ncbi:MAG: Activator of Hsp90 ATPase 1 family protein [uncultured bacterium]|nr:MAG: Activator of Hsp90 ATPase 1 family protein [uncultured bacterium]KKT75627.1 MAG: Activator of Hsp90 ATPase 1 family protein [Candidatus Peregrinibacteria bacterium GW2011_GWA2_44_7]
MTDTAPQEEFVITRTFNSPLEMVWKAFTEVDRLKHWWGTMKVATLNFSPGGLFHYRMQSPDGQDMWGKFVYREIVPMEKIVFVNSFSDEQGNTARHPMAPNWPLEMLNHFTLEEHGGKTTLTLRGRAINATEEEVKTYNDNHESMHIGFTGTWDQLEAYLSETLNK